jgi:hypothetical protein
VNAEILHLPHAGTSEKGEWLRVATLVIASLAIALGGFATGFLMNHEHRVTILEESAKTSKEVDAKTEAAIKEVRDDLRGDIREIKETLKQIQRGR